MPQIVHANNLAAQFAPGELVYLAGASGAALAFVEALLADSSRSADLRILTSYVPGINTLDLDRLHPTARTTGLFMLPKANAAQRDGRFRALGMTYAGFARYVRHEVVPDLAVVQVAPPDARGRCSLGPAVEFMPEVLKKARRVLALINQNVPAIPGAFTVPFEDFTAVCEVGNELATYVTESDSTTEAIATNLASVIRDGATLQVGLGKVPAALFRQLKQHRRLRLHSGMLSDGLIDLAEAGALDADFLHTTTVLVGSKRLYDWLPEFDRLRVPGAEVTHDLPTLINTRGMTAINSALEVDLFGQCNLEHASGRAISSVGGAPDFARGARLADEGVSIVALNATFNKGKSSHIQPTLGENGVASLPRIDVDMVVTEYGIARLRGCGVHERAQALIGVAAPEFRDELQAAWNGIAAKL